MLRLRWLGLLCGFALVCATQANDAEQIVRQALLSIQPDLPIEKITASPMPSLYQVELMVSFCYKVACFKLRMAKRQT